MLKNKYLILISFIFLFFQISLYPVLADTISPFFNKVSLKAEGRTWESIKYTNEEDTTKEILLKVYGYNLQKEEMDVNIPVLLRVDTDTFTIKPKESKDIPYEIVLPNNIAEGTYFNLLVLQQITGKTTSSITTSPLASQIVRIDIYPKDSTNNIISTTPASVTLELISKGIPWIKAAEIKYSYTNTSNYILQPEGELQIFNEKQNTKPIYVKINEDEKFIYPGETLTETIKINKWNVSDLIYKRLILGRFYNGIDGKYQGVQITVDSFRDEVLIIGVVLLFIFAILVESSKSRARKLPKDYDEEGEDEE